jgi:site-specific recombinase XerD
MTYKTTASPDAPIHPGAERQIAIPPSANFVIVPAIVADLGDNAAKRFLEFFTANIRNKNTRAAYAQAVAQFLHWCEGKHVALKDVEPIHVAGYVELLQQRTDKPLAAPSVKQHLAAIRTLFDWLVVGQIISQSPAASVRGPKHVVKKGKTPALSAEDARKLLDSIPVKIGPEPEQGQHDSRLPDLVGLRDRALIATMAFSFARIGAVLGMKVEDYYPNGKRWWIRLHEKGGKFHEVPAHHTLEEYLDAYIQAAGIAGEPKAPLFRSANRRSGRLTGSALRRNNALDMVKRRAMAAGFPRRICCHTFRATGITAYLEEGGTIEKAQQIAFHESPKTTKLYDRTSDQIDLDEIERIRI